MWLGLVSRLWPWLAVALVLIGGAVYLRQSGYKAGYEASEAHWRPRFEAAAFARDVANEKARRTEADSKAITQQSEIEHAKTLSSLALRAADADKRIRALSLRVTSAGTCRGEVRAVPGTPAEPDAAAASLERADRAGAGIADVGRRCELDAATLAELQTWVIEQRKIMTR
jgi:hypothetical protein